jgi:hypothetical protein
MNIKTLVCASLFVLLSVSASDANVVNLKARKTGYWEMTLTQKSGDWNKTETYHACLDVDNDMSMTYEIAPASKGVCNDTNIQSQDTDSTWDSECTLGGMSNKTHNTLRFNGDESYKIVANGTYGVDGNEAQFQKSETAKWLGAECPANLKPGYRDKGNGVITDELGKLVE